MAIQAKTKEEVLVSIAAKKAAGFLPASFEIELPEGNYEGWSTGLYKDVDYTNAKGKGLIIFACVEVENDKGEIVSIDVPIKESLVGMWNENDAVNFEVFRKDENAPKRVKLLMESADVDVTKENPNAARIAEINEALKTAKGAAKATLTKELAELSA